MKPSLVIVGLGNPGAQYSATRHNIGFQAVDALAESFGEGQWGDKQKFLSEICEARIGVVPVLLVKPTTYMNRSGEAVVKIMTFHDLEPSQILVISDDIDLPLADCRLRMKGGPGTHNGLKSVIEYIGEEFPRIRIGLGEHPAEQDLSNWVLSRPSKEEQEAFSKTYDGLSEMLREFVG